MTIVLAGLLLFGPEPLQYNNAVLATLFNPAFWLAFLLFATAFFIMFFRDPEREGPPDGMLSPADGKVMPDRGDDTLRIFMNVHNVHVNRAPLQGRVKKVEHRPGGLKPAFSKDSDLNERTRILLDTDHGEIVVTQIAGTLARRIVTYVQPGEKVARGQRIGLIRLGSRVDVTIPEDFRLRVEKGEAIKAGETVVAENVGKASGGRRRGKKKKDGAGKGGGEPDDPAPPGRKAKTGDESFREESSGDDSEPPHHHDQPHHRPPGRRKPRARLVRQVK